MNKIIFHSNRNYNDNNEHMKPVAAKKYIPEWYLKADRYERNIHTGDYYVDHEGDKTLSFKSCPALLDLFTSGYYYLTPCDLNFYYDKKIKAMNVETEKGFEDFCSVRPQMHDFDQPEDSYKEHFHWYPAWAPSVPEGYSVLYINPSNRYNAPFITTSGIIDNDKMDTPGLFPFFLKNNFSGIIKKGTPYLHIIPFKRDDWQAEYQYYTYDKIVERHENQAKKYRDKKGGRYRKNTWSKKNYD